MITKWDEYLIHQTGEPIDQMAGPEDEWFDHFCIFLHPKGPGAHLGTGVYVYPNTDVLAAWLIAVGDDMKQYNCRATRELSHDRDATVGPFSFTVIEPLRRWAFRLAKDPYYPVTFNLEFEARTPLIDTGTYKVPKGPKSPFDISHTFVLQLVRYKGSFTIAGKHYDATGYIGLRNRGWGLRTEYMGIGYTGNVHAQFDDFSIEVMYIEGRDGVVQSGSKLGAIYKDSGETLPIVGIEHNSVPNII